TTHSLPALQSAVSQGSRSNHGIMATANPAPAVASRSHESPFVNEEFVDFASAENRRAMQAALAAVESQLGREYDLVIGGQRLRTEGRIVSVNPARPAQVVGIHSKACVEHVQQAIDAAQGAFSSWSRVSAADRSGLLFRAADLIRERKFEFSAWLVYEVGKNWAEADADVGETIDFLEFYGREALRLAAVTTPIQFPGEH